MHADMKALGLSLLLLAVGVAAQEAMVKIKETEALYQVFQEPFIFEFDRSQCNTTAAPEHSCLCYSIPDEERARVIDNRVSDLCGRGFGMICTSVPQKSRLYVYLKGNLASYEVGTHVSIPAFLIYGKQIDGSERVGNFVLLKASDSCSSIRVENLLDQSRDIADCDCTCHLAKPKDEF